MMVGGATTAYRTSSSIVSIARSLSLVAFAVVLFGLNNLAILSGWLYPPQGYEPAFMIRTQDIAQYLTWVHAFQSQLLIPNYHAPWITEPALFNLFMWLLSHLSTLLGSSFVITYHLTHLALYIIAAFALWAALRVFMLTNSQRRMALLAIFCSVPLQSLAVLPLFVLTPGRKNPLPGLGDFVWWSSDGFFHGISGSILVTLGTATTLLAFVFLATYLKTEERRYLVYAALTTFLSAVMHPFEVFVIGSAGAVTLVLWRGRQWRTALPEVAALGLAAVAGLAPYALLVLQHPWLRGYALLNHWQPGSPLRVLVMLGLPTILALALLVVRPKTTSPTDLLLRSWFVCTLIGIYIPWLPWSQHLLDGFHYAAGLLLVRQVSEYPALTRLPQVYPRLARVVLVTVGLLSLAAYVAFHIQSFQDGHAVTPERLFSTIAPRDELAAVEWIQHRAQADQLLLAPPESAPWFAPALVHSFASHHLLSLTYEEQARLATEFYSGQLDARAAHDLLSEYGVHYVVMPEGSPALTYLQDARQGVRFGSLLLYELDGHAMKPYPGLQP